MEYVCKVLQQEEFACNATERAGSFPNELNISGIWLPYGLPPDPEDMAGKIRGRINTFNDTDWA